MADIEKVKRNIGRMIDGGASESEIDQYLAIEGVDLQAIKSPAPQGGVSDSGFSVVDMAKNVPGSAAQLGKDIVQPIIHPVDTAKALWSVVTDDEARSAVGQFFKDRYGGWEEIKNTVEKDPVGFMADVSTVFTGGGMAAAKLPGTVGRAAGAIAKAGQYVDPLNVAGRWVGPTAKTVAGPAASSVLGNFTGTGGEAVKQAAQAGYHGGARGSAFLDNMRGNVPIDAVVSEAKKAVANLRQQRSDQYRAGMKGITADPTVLDFKPIDDSMRNISSVGTYKGKVVRSSTEGTWDQIAQKVNEWRQADPAEFHTPEGLDALKQAIGDIRDSTQFGTPSRVMADNVYNAIKGQIVKQAPGYAKVMKDYEIASDLLRDMEKTLSINPKASVDTTLRKLQSVLRNNVNANFGQRAKLVSDLEGAGAPNLTASLSGQSMNTWTPRGLQNMTLSGALMGGVGMMNPQLLAMAPLTSPRLVGEAAYRAGQGARVLNNPMLREVLPKAGLPSYQAGRLTALLQQ